VPNLRVLVAYEEAYLSYAQAFGAAVRIAEPLAEVRVVGLGELEAEVSSFEPHLVISSQPADALPGVGAWFRLPHDPDEPSEFRLGDQVWTYANPELGTLGKVVEGVSRLVQEGRDPAVL
jgi:hypothetical protein